MPDCDEPTIVRSTAYGFDLSQESGPGKGAQIVVTPFDVPRVNVDREQSAAAPRWIAALMRLVEQEAT